MMDSNRIKQIRLRLGLSQERFAQLLGVSWHTVRRWESGTTRPLPIISRKLQELQRTAMAQRRVGGIPMTGSRRSSEASAELGLGGLLKGIGRLLSLVSKMDAEGKEEYSQSGELGHPGGGVRGVYGFSIRTGLEGQPVIEQFGNIKETDAGPEVVDTREPLVDVLEEQEQVVVIAELPGIDEKDVQVHVEEDILEIAAFTGARGYQKEVSLPVPVDSASFTWSYKNGVLDIRLPKR